MEFTKFDPQEVASSRKSDTKKRIALFAASIISVAAVACVAVVMFGQISENTTENLSSQSKFLSKESLSNSQVTEFLALSQATGITQKKLVGMITGSKQGSPILQRAQGLIVFFIFDLIDSNDNQKVEKTEWTAFITALFPQDVNTYVPLFEQINSGQPFDLKQLLAFVSQKAQSEDAKNLTPKTANKVTELGFAKLILFDDRNYGLTYTLIFKIFDFDENKTVSKNELQDTLVAFNTPQKKASEAATQILAFSKQNKFGDGNSITFDNFKTFAVAAQKPLQEQLKKQTTLFKMQSIKDANLLAQFGEPASELFQVVYEKVFVSSDDEEPAEPSEEHQKILTHFFTTFTAYSFNLLDSNGDGTLTKVEYRAFVDQIFKNKADKNYYYAFFEKMNKGKDVNLQQFQEFIVSQVAPPPHDGEGEQPPPPKPYKPKEKKEVIGQRFAQLLVNNDRNYQLTYSFVFDLFDLDSDQVVQAAEVKSGLGAVAESEDLPKLEKKVDKAFAALQKLGTGDGKKVTKEEWSALAQKVRPELVKGVSSGKGIPTLLFLQ